MSNMVFPAKSREKFGSAASKRLRSAGRIPAVIYGHNGTSHIDLDEKSFSLGIRNATESTIVTVDVEGQSHDTFIKNTQRNILNGKIEHVDFYEIETSKTLRARVPLRVFGNPVGVRDGGVLEVPLHDIEVECLPKDLPPRIEVDISGLKANQSIHVKDLDLGEGVKLISGLDQVIALVKFAKEVAEAAAEAAPAEGAAAATPDAKDAKGEASKDGKSS